MGAKAPYKYSTMSHFMEMLGHEAMDAPYPVRLLWRSLSSFWNIGRIARSNSSPSDTAEHIAGTLVTDAWW